MNSIFTPTKFLEMLISGSFVREMKLSSTSCHQIEGQMKWRGKTFDQFPTMCAIAKATVTTGMKNMTNGTSEMERQVTERHTMDLEATVHEVMVLEAMVSEVMGPATMVYTRMDQSHQMEPEMEPTVMEQTTDLKVMVLQATVLVPKPMAQVTALVPRLMAQVTVRIPETEAAMVMEIIIPMETQTQTKDK